MAAKKKILVHVCCASCASHVLRHLSKLYDVTAYFFNPNIQPEEEYILRLEETRNLCREQDIPLVEGTYEPALWRRAVEPYRSLPERSERCWECYSLRLEDTAKKAAEAGIGIFTTTLSVSPHKVYDRIVEAGEAAGEHHGTRFHGEDFKKKDGFKISVRRSRELGLTRQDYCGCILSLEESRKRKEEKGKRAP